MSRLLTAALLLAMATAPAVACPWNQSADSDASKPSTVAAQPTDDQASPPPPPVEHKAS
jgi:hypothetical protein